LQYTQVSTHQGIWQHEFLPIITIFRFHQYKFYKIQLVYKIFKTKTNPDFLIMLQYFDILLFSFQKDSEE